MVRAVETRLAFIPEVEGQRVCMFKPWPLEWNGGGDEREVLALLGGMGGFAITL